MQPQAFSSSVGNFLTGLLILIMTPVAALCAPTKESTVIITKPSPDLAQRQLERRKQEWRDIKAEQRRVADDFLRCLDAATSLPAIATCERAERDELANIKRLMRGSESGK